MATEPLPPHLNTTSSINMAATTFHKFPELPQELQDQIWSYAITSASKHRPSLWMYSPGPPKHLTQEVFSSFSIEPYPSFMVPWAMKLFDGTKARLIHPNMPGVAIYFPVRWYCTGVVRLMNTCCSSRLAVLRRMRSLLSRTTGYRRGGDTWKLRWMDQARFLSVVEGLVDELEARMQGRRPLVVTQLS